MKTVQLIVFWHCYWHNVNTKMTDTLRVFLDMLSIMSSVGRGRLLFSAGAPSLHCQAPVLRNTKEVLMMIMLFLCCFDVDHSQINAYKKNRFMFDDTC